MNTSTREIGAIEKTSLQERPITNSSTRSERTDPIMNNEIKGEIHQIGDTQTFESGFTKRLCVITFTDGSYENHLAIDFVKEKCSVLDRFQVGQTVTISFNLRSNENENKPGQWFTNPTAWKIEGEHQSQAQQQQPAPSQPVITTPEQRNQQGAMPDGDKIPFGPFDPLNLFQ